MKYSGYLFNYEYSKIIPKIFSGDRGINGEREDKDINGNADMGQHWDICQKY